VLLTATSPDEAIALYRKLEGLRPGDAQVHLRLGLLLEHQGMHAEGAAEIATARRLDPSIPPAP
jgi:Flp pilus assembly protein TadD